MGPQAPTSILITGASSGIGAALALAYSAPGVTLALGGRDRDRLDRVAESCRAGGAAVEANAVDVLEPVRLARWVETAHARRPLDLVVANAGISAGTGGIHGETAEQARHILAVNVGGVIDTVLPALALMRPRRHGQVAIMSSLAGYRGMPGAPAYCAAKAAVRVWGEALRAQLAPEGIRVSVICPGFVATPMTAINRFPMPFLVDATRAAAIIRRGLARDRGRIAFPWPLAALARLLTLLPDPLADRLSRRTPRKD